MNKLSQTLVFNDVVKKYPQLKGVLNFDTLQNYSYDQEDYAHNYHAVSLKKYPLTPIILKLAKESKIRLFNFSDPKTSVLKAVVVPSSLMGFAVTNPKDPREVISFINAVNRAAYQRIKGSDEPTNLKLDELSLYAYLQMGAASYICKKYDADLTNSGQFAADVAEVYANMMSKVINIQYPISGDMKKYDVLKFLTALYCLQVMFGYESDRAISTAFLMKNIEKKDILLECQTLANEEVEMRTIMDLVTVIENEFSFIKKGSISFRSLATGFASTFGGTSLMAIEYSQYFINMLLCVSCGANLFNDKMIKSVCPKRNLDNILKMLAKMSSL